MAVIRIRERSATDAGIFEASLRFDDTGEYGVEVRDPFSEQEEERLEWYFERYLCFPFVEEVRFREAAASVERYGEDLFAQVFRSGDDSHEIYARYKAGLGAGGGEVMFEIAGSPAFHGLHWEALKDPDQPRPFAVDSTMVRKNLRPQGTAAGMPSSPTLNVLLVTARPSGGRDVGYRTISRPLVEMLRRAEQPVRLEILRPGTWEALSRHREEVRDRAGAGFYHLIHFDLHGSLLAYEDFQQGVENGNLLYDSRYGRGEIEPYEGQQAFLFFEGQDGQAKSDPVTADEVAALLQTHRLPVAVLNACQSGKQVGASETSLGSRLIAAGTQMVLAMGYSVTVSAAAVLMEQLYRQLFQGRDLAAAARRGRLELYSRKQRRAYFNQTIDLEDWVLPVAYQNRRVRFELRDFEPEERRAYYEREARRYRPPATAYRFVGRDLDVLEVEKRLLGRCNVLLVRGLGGAGKTTLLHHLASWWQATHFVDRVFYFGYDEQAWSRQQILVAVARELLGEARFHGEFQPLGLAAQQALLAKELRARRHLLILDNLESITGAHLAIENRLSEAEREALRELLADLEGGRTLVLLGSRGGEEWLAPGTFGDNLYELPGLDAEAASELAELILERHGATKYREDRDLVRLLKLLQGYPLALEVVLANLARQTPAEVLEALEAGDVDLDRGDAQSKTESIVRCIDYSHSQLSPDAQGLLACLAPFTGVINTAFLPQYTEQLRAQPVLAELPFERWQEVLEEAADWGLLKPHSQVPGYLQLQPIFPYFLRARLQGRPETRSAIDEASRVHYQDVGASLAQLMMSKKAEEKQVGQVLTGLEYENLRTALRLALAAEASVLNPYHALSLFLDATQNQRGGLELGEEVLERLDKYPTEKLRGPLGVELAGVVDDIAKRLLLLKSYAKAEATYARALDLFEQAEEVEDATRGKLKAGVLHQLGMVAEEQRQWPQAEKYYQTALEIDIEFNDRYSQASTYHQLGSVAEEQRQWPQAEKYYQTALEIKIEFNDRYSQASTYHQLGVVAQKQRQWSQAEKYYRNALEIKIEFNDRYEQAGTYHQLGRVAQEQRQWPQGRDYALKALAIFAEFKDSHNLGICVRTLARLWRESGDATIPGAMADILGVKPEDGVEMLKKLAPEEPSDPGTSAAPP